MITDDSPSRQTFSYAAQSFDGKPVTGTIDAADLDDAARQLTSLQLRVMQLHRASPPARAKPLGRDDFFAFNQQLAHLTGAGLPIEHGLRLIAEDMRSSRAAQSVRDVATEMERGVPLADAFNKHANQFPALYGTIIQAGVRSGNLSAVLLNLGRHLDLVARLRATLWRSAAYPLIVTAGVFAVLIFLGMYVFPQFEEIYAGFQTNLPSLTEALFAASKWIPWVIGIGVALFVGGPVLHLLLRAVKLDRFVADLALRLPLVGKLLRRNLIARWCDALKLSISGGMDLPAALEQAAQIVASPALRRDTASLINRLRGGQPIDQPPIRLSLLPQAVIAVVQVSADRGDLEDSLQTLSGMYEQQADMHLVTIHAVLGPLLILGVAVLVGVVILALFAPMISLIQSVSSP